MEEEETSHHQPQAGREKRAEAGAASMEGDHWFGVWTPEVGAHLLLLSSRLPLTVTSGQVLAFLSLSSFIYKRSSIQNKALFCS